LETKEHIGNASVTRHKIHHLHSLNSMQNFAVMFLGMHSEFCILSSNLARGSTYLMKTIWVLILNLWDFPWGIVCCSPDLSVELNW